MAQIKQLRDSLKSIQGDEDAKGLLSMNCARLVDEIVGVFRILEAGAESYAYCFQKFTGDASRYAYNLWLLDPAIIFKPLVSTAKSVSLLSGTLTPFSSFYNELGHPFTHQIVAPHILKPEQVFIASIRQGHLGRDLCGTYAIAETQAYLDQISRIIEDVSRKVGGHGGTLVFVPSYVFLNKLASRIKDVVVEPKAGGAADFEKAMRAYQGKIAAKRPAILLCVYRGKAAEGIDFRDEFAWAVVAVGIPFPSVRDPQISLKKEYNDKKGAYGGRLWYEAQAYRALNQALGRVIRHAEDWGAVFLLDSRFADARSQASLSSWVSANLRGYETYESSKGDLEAFIIICLYNPLRVSG